MKNTYLKLLASLSGICFAFVTTLFYCCNPPLQKNDVKFYIVGNATRNIENNTLDIYLRNVSPDGSDYLIALGDVTYQSSHEEGNFQILKTSVQSINGAPYMAKLNPSDLKSKIVTHNQVLPLKFAIPNESQSARIDYIDMDILLCGAPISTKHVALDKLTVRILVKDER